ncbi:ribonuclease J [Bradyrhizobium sp. USDA 4341]
MNIEQKGRPVLGLRTVNPASLNLDPSRPRLPVPGPDEIVICPLGGVGRIGMNWTLCGHAGSWVLVDMGFAMIKDVPGVEFINPSIEMLKPIIPNLKALLVTHAHEDHIGAIVPIFGQLGRRLPIHATPFASEIIKGRMNEAGLRHIINTFRPGEGFQVGPFKIVSIPVAHSVPEAVAFAIGTRAGIVLHTGDWKIDPDPVIGHRTSLRAFEKLGERGVLALLADSTNAERSAVIPSEKQVARNLQRVFHRKRGLIVASCFATNVDRVAGMIRAARASGRVVALAGRSMLKNEEAARKIGLLGPDLKILSDPRHLAGFDRHRMTLICTGTQAEPNSALDRMSAGGARHLPKIQPGDTIIHSARTIPGRELEVREMMTALENKGAEILMAADEEGNPLHASGHAIRSDIEMLHRLVKPRFVIPVHGEPDHLKAHAEIALSAGAAEAPILREGEMISVSRDGAKRLGCLPVELIGGRRTQSNRYDLFPVNEDDLVPVVDRTRRAGYERSRLVAV